MCELYDYSYGRSQARTSKLLTHSPTAHRLRMKAVMSNFAVQEQPNQHQQQQQQQQQQE